MGKPRVSVIITAYNASGFVADAIESVLQQTFQDFELIVIDDGSTDNTADVCGRYADKIRYEFQENSGSAAARNAGIRVARGEYIAFLDADDIWLPDKLGRQLTRLDIEKDICWAYSDFHVVDSQSNEVLYRASQLVRRPDGDVLEQLMMGNVIAPSCVIIHRKVFGDVGVFDTSPLRRISEDWELFMRIAGQYPILYIEKPLVRIRQHTSRKTTTMDLDQALRSRLQTLNEAASRSPGRLRSQLPRAMAHLYVNIGRKWLERDARPEARTLFWEAIKQHPRYAPAWMYGAAAWVPRRILNFAGQYRKRFRKGKA